MTLKVVKTPEEEWPDERIAALEHLRIGPTWRTDDEGDYVIPEKTLGWQVIAWCMLYLAHPSAPPGDDGEYPGWEFTPEQARFILWWFAVNDEGRFVYRSGVLQRLKGWGKDPLLAVLCLVELVGPSMFYRFDDGGEPIGVANPVAHVQIAATTKDQTGTTFAMFPRIITEDLRRDYGLEVQGQNIWANGRRQHLEIVTANPRSLEGRRTTFVVLNEIQHWIAANKGIAMFNTIRDNTAKAPGGRGRWLAITNAYMPGEESVGELLRVEYETEQETNPDGPTDFLYDSVEAAPDTPLVPHVLEQVLGVIRGDSEWLDIPTIVATIMRRSTTVARARRMWLNQIVSSDDALIPERVWAGLRSPDRGEDLNPGDLITLGFDGGRTDDFTALVAIRLRDRLVVPLGIWERGDEEFPDGGEIRKDAVRAAVARAFTTYSVAAMYADVREWESDVAEWGTKYREKLQFHASVENSIVWDMRSLKKVTMANERFLTAVEDGLICHQGRETLLSRRLWRHVINTCRSENRWGVGFSKESKDSQKKIDAYAAMILAHEAMHSYLGRKRDEKPRSGRVFSTVGQW